MDFCEGDAIIAEPYGGTLEMLTAAHSSQKAWLAMPSRFSQQSQAPYCQPEHTIYSVTAGGLLNDLPSVISRAAISLV